MTVESILVATDLTDASDPQLRSAGALAAALDASLHVLHAFDERQLPDLPADMPPTFQARIRQARAALDEQIARTVSGDVDVASRHVVIYLAGKAIVERAHEVRADLVVIGPHRKRRFADAYLGATADFVVRNLRRPCLITRGPLQLPLARLVVTTDLSPAARPGIQAALDWASTLGRSGEPGTRLYVVHVLDRLLQLDADPADLAALRAELDDAIDDAVGDAGPASHIRISSDVREGESPADEIVALARSETTDLLVLGTHGYGAVKRALIGSVAGTVARAAPCSVLLVPSGDIAAASDAA